MKEPFFPRKSCPPSVQTSSPSSKYHVSSSKVCTWPGSPSCPGNTTSSNSAYDPPVSFPNAFNVTSTPSAHKVIPSPASIRFLWACQKNSVLIQNASAMKSPHNSLWKNRERESDTQQMQTQGCHITTHRLKTWLVVSKGESKQAIWQKVLCHHPWEIHEEEEWQLLQKSR